jgi:hypothetical protein
MLEAAGPEGELSESEAIGIIDRFALQHRLPNGKTVLDQLLASRLDLTAADREMLRGWHHPVEGIFEIRGKDQGAIVLLNLLDDLEYRTYSNVCPAAFRRLPKAGSCTRAWCPSARCPGSGWSPGRWRATPPPAPRRSRRPRSTWRRGSLNWPTAIQRESSRAGRVMRKGQGRVHRVLRRR